MTRVSSNIIHPRAWIFTQFSIANIASAILVSSNPTNLVLAGAFNIKFINYIVFADEALIPLSIKMHELSEEAKAKEPVNPNIPNSRGIAEEEEKLHTNDEQGQALSLEEIMNPFLDKGGAAFGAFIMAATLSTVLALNAASQSKGEQPVFWVTLPAAFIMFCWDLFSGWVNRHKTRDIARKGRQEVELARAERARREEDEAILTSTEQGPPLTQSNSKEVPSSQRLLGSTSSGEGQEEKRVVSTGITPNLTLKHGRIGVQQRATLVSLSRELWGWLQETFPTVTAVLGHLPFALIPFAFAMFVLVQALVVSVYFFMLQYFQEAAFQAQIFDATLC
jgi:Na+/H+ antiporter NhaD/arsenite permease-like protein